MSKQYGPSVIELTKIISKLNLTDLNKAIYCCEQEERDAGNGGVYSIPGYGPLVYSGSQGFNSLLSVIGPNNDLGHPLCRNLREGNWMIGERVEGNSLCVFLFTFLKITLTSVWINTMGH